MLRRYASLSALGYAYRAAGAAWPQAGVLERSLTSRPCTLNSIDDPNDDFYDDKGQRVAIPWVRTVISGVGIMRNPRYNKGLAFSDNERDRLHLRGLLPPAILSLETQMERVMINVRMKASDLERYSYLQSLQERNEHLFFKVVREHISELLPIVHLPTVRKACKKYGLMFKSLPKSLFLTRQDVGGCWRVLKNWPERLIKVAMVTDGQVVGPAGDLGVHAVNAVIAKLGLMTAIGGLNPSLMLPVQVDMGTNNEELLKSQFYSGLRHKRLDGEAADSLTHELITGIEKRFGKHVVLFFEDMKYSTTQTLLSQYGTTFPCFADDYQGLAASVLAATLGAIPDTGTALKDHRILVLGSGPHRVCIAEMLSSAISFESRGMASEARQNIFLFDNDGLVTTTSPHADREDEEMRETLLYSKDMPNSRDIDEVMQKLKPTILISCTSNPASVQTIPESAIRTMSKHCARPIIFAISSPNAEVSAAQAYHWSGGKAMYANFEGQQEEVTTPHGQVLTPSKVQSVYIFPGIALGTCVARATRIKEEQIVAAAKAVAAMVSDEDRELGRVLPPVFKLHAVAKQVAYVTAKTAYDSGVATALPKPADLTAMIDSYIHDPSYPRFG